MYEIKYIKMYFIIEFYIIKFLLRSFYMICVREFFLSARERLNISLQYPVGNQDGDLGILLMSGEIFGGRKASIESAISTTSCLLCFLSSHGEIAEQD